LKKLLSLGLALSLAVGVTGCGFNNRGENEQTTQEYRERNVKTSETQNTLEQNANEPTNNNTIVEPDTTPEFEPVLVSNETELRAAVASAGNKPTAIVLTSDIELISNFIIPANANIKLTGENEVAFSFVATREVSIIEIEQNATLTLEHITVTRTIESSESVGIVGVNNNGTFIINSGEVSGTYGRTGMIGGDGISNKGTLLMNGGTVKNNGSGAYGSGVNNSGTFTMYGGTISDNSVGVKGDGSFAMHNGTISNNQTGGGVWVSYFEMFGGTISDNFSSMDGGGVKAGLTMYGGTISGNSSMWGGGGISSNNFTMKGGIISNNFVVDKDFYEGGGISIHQRGTFVFEGGWIFDNIAKNDNDICLGKDSNFQNNVFDPNIGAIGSPPPA
jgi:hypothetical protein